MRALTVSAPGSAPVLTELPAAEAGAGTVLVRVQAASLNPIDNLIAAGSMAAMLPYEYPLVLGRDAAGVVAAVGEGVSGFSAGDPVLGHVPLVPPIQAGTLAEYVVLPATHLATRPAQVDPLTAAAIPLAGAAAHAVIEGIGDMSGVVLVNGASGGVGSFVLQLLSARGLEVIATGGPQDGERLRGLGATEVVDFTAGAVSDQVRRLRPDGVDALINLHGHTIDQVPLAAVRRGGVVATTTSAPDAAALEAAGLHGGVVRAAPTADVLRDLADRVAAGKIAVGIEATFPLDEALDGLAALATGTATGKLVVTVAD